MPVASLILDSASARRCPSETWCMVFGEPDRIEQHDESEPIFPVEVWEYPCVDGPIRCVGYQVDDLSQVDTHYIEISATEKLPPPSSTTGEETGSTSGSLGSGNSHQPAIGPRAVRNRTYTSYRPGISWGETG